MQANDMHSNDSNNDNNKPNTHAFRKAFPFTILYNLNIMLTKPKKENSKTKQTHFLFSKINLKWKGKLWLSDPRQARVSHENNGLNSKPY